MIEQSIPYFHILGHGILTLSLVSVLVFFAFTFSRDFPYLRKKFQTT